MIVPFCSMLRRRQFKRWVQMCPRLCYPVYQIVILFLQLFLFLYFLQFPCKFIQFPHSIYWLMLLRTELILSLVYRWHPSQQSLIFLRLQLDYLSLMRWQIFLSPSINCQILWIWLLNSLFGARRSVLIWSLIELEDFVFVWEVHLSKLLLRWLVVTIINYKY